MLTNLIITVVCEDRPGIVETLAKLITDNHGNWLESSFSQLAGKFAGVLCVQVEETKQNDLIAGLNALSSKGMSIQVDVCQHSAIPPGKKEQFSFSALGPDRKGIIKEFSQAFATKGINIESMDTRLSSMPYSGDPLFEASGQLSIPDGLDITNLEEDLKTIADELGLDFTLNENT